MKRGGTSVAASLMSNISQALTKYCENMLYLVLRYIHSTHRLVPGIYLFELFIFIWELNLDDLVFL